jgi:sphingomyelin phosphodiesterase acid-like 3
MKHYLARHFSRILTMRQIALCCFLLIAAAALAQSNPPAATTHVTSHSQPVPATVPALLVSDIHFEPFWDPDKVAQLVSAPVSEWRSILSAAPSPDQQQRFESLQQSCHARGSDTSYPLFDSSLQAMRKSAAGAKFVTVSGDLLSHAFQCKYNTLIPGSSPTAYKTFVEKTLSFVIGQLKGAIPNVPIYIALGNNDSDCGDYRLDAHSEFLSETGKDLTSDFPASERDSARSDFSAGGYYSVSLPAPIQNARLLVLDDIFMSKNYATCAGKADPAAADAQLAWLRQQLAEARAGKRKIWVMGHIPPGVDLYATARKLTDICGGQSPTMFLSSEKMVDVMAEYDDVIELVIFAHTHMDELRLLKQEGKVSTTRKGVAVKMVPSISPINGNHPSFTLAQIDPSTAKLVDYRVFAASNLTGVDANWKEEYDFASSFHKSEFTSSSLAELIAGFKADPGDNAQASQNYIQDFSVGSASPLLSIAWPQYVCTLTNFTQQAFKACVCPAVK